MAVAVPQAASSRSCSFAALLLQQGPVQRVSRVRRAPRLAAALEMGRQALHAAKLEFRFPPRITRTFTAPLAPDMKEFVVAKMGFSEVELDVALAA